MADMGDLTSKISSLLSSPEGMQQLQNMASALGLGSMVGGQQNSEPSTSEPQPNQSQSAPAQGGAPGGFDMGNLMGMLQNMANQSSQQSNSSPQENSVPPQGGAPGGFDMGSLMGMLQNMSSQGGQQAGAPQGGSPGGFDMGSLMGMLQNMSSQGGGQQAGTPQGGAPGGFDMGSLMGMLQNMGLGGGQSGESSSSLPSIDFNTILKIQKAMMAFAKGNKNVDLLRCLKPHLSEKRAKKVDDAIKIMQLINLLPMIKESGIFGLGGEGR